MPFFKFADLAVFAIAMPSDLPWSHAHAFTYAEGREALAFNARMQRPQAMPDPSLCNHSFHFASTPGYWRTQIQRGQSQNRSHSYVPIAKTRADATAAHDLLLLEQRQCHPVMLPARGCWRWGTGMYTVRLCNVNEGAVPSLKTLNCMSWPAYTESQVICDVRK